MVLKTVYCRCLRQPAFAKKNVYYIIVRIFRMWMCQLKYLNGSAAAYAVKGIPLRCAVTVLHAVRYPVDLCAK